MIRRTFPATALILGTITWISAPAVAQGPPDGPLPDQAQERLLDRFGDEGIDADGDGVLTRTEVRSFFSEKRGPGNQGPLSGKRFGRHGGKRGAHGANGPGFRGPGRRGPGHGGPGFGGPGGPRHHGPGGPPPLAMLLKRLEALSADSPPERFSLERFPRADTDGDGQLSDAEWRAFADEVRTRMLDKLLEHAPEIDADENGEVSDAELEAFAAEAKARHLERILDRHPEADTDGDGTLSNDEMETLKHDRMAKHHARIIDRHPEADTDGDGTLSREEAKAFFDAQRDGKPKPYKASRRRHGRRPRGIGNDK